MLDPMLDPNRLDRAAIAAELQGLVIGDEFDCRPEWAYSAFGVVLQDLLSAVPDSDLARVRATAIRSISECIGDDSMYSELYNFETEQVEGCLKLTQAEVNHRNTRLRASGDPLRWVVKSQDEDIA